MTSHETEPRPCPICGSDDVGVITQTSLFFRDSVEVYVLCGACAAAEVEAVRHGAAKFAFTVIGPVIVFQFRFGTALSWSDALYTWHKVPVEERVEPAALSGEQRVPVEVFLVDATTGIVQAIRVLTLSPTFSRRLHEAIRRQAAEPFPDNYDELAARVLDTYTGRQLRDRALASCNGGDEIDRPSPY